MTDKTHQTRQERPIRQPHDRLAKLLSRAVLGGCADVQIGVELLPDSLAADVLAEPYQALPLDLPGAGLLSRLVGSRLALIESFSTAPDPLELRSAVAKLQLALRLAEQKRAAGARPARGCLVVVTPSSAAAAIAAVLGSRGGSMERGVRRWGHLDPIYVVRADRVGGGIDTLFFRLQARGAITRVALVEV